MESKTYFVYILMQSRDETLYTGIASDLFTRTYELASEKQYMVYYEPVCDPNAAIAREFELRSFDQTAKRSLIERDNPGWQDLGSRF